MITEGEYFSRLKKKKKKTKQKKKQNKKTVKMFLYRGAFTAHTLNWVLHAEFPATCTPSWELKTAKKKKRMWCVRTQ